MQGSRVLKEPSSPPASVDVIGLPVHRSERADWVGVDQDGRQRRWVQRYTAVT